MVLSTAYTWCGVVSHAHSTALGRCWQKDQKVNGVLIHRKPGASLDYTRPCHSEKQNTWQKNVQSL